MKSLVTAAVLITRGDSHGLMMMSLDYSLYLCIGDKMMLLRTAAFGFP